MSPSSSLGHANINYGFESAQDQIDVGVSILQGGSSRGGLSRTSSNGRNLSGTEQWLKASSSASSPPFAAHNQDSFDSMQHQPQVRMETTLPANYTTSVLMSARDSLSKQLMKRKNSEPATTVFVDDGDLFGDDGDDDHDTKIIIIKSPFK